MGKILRLENYVGRPAYETAYKFVVKDRELFWEVAQHLTGDKDFANSRVSIGTTPEDYVPSFPHFHIDEQGVYFGINCSMNSCHWDWENEKRQKLDSLVRKHVNPNYKFTDWKNLEIVNEKKEVTSWYDNDERTFTYQFNDISESNEQQFLRELQEALKIQQIILSKQVSIRDSTVIIGNPYLYSGGLLWRGAKPEAIAKFRELTDDYLMKRLPDIEEARRIFSGIIPKLYESEQKTDRLERENERLFMSRFEFKMLLKLSKIHRAFDTKTELEIEKRCKTIGIDREIYNSMTYEQAIRFIGYQKRFWIGVYCSDGNFDERMKDINEAADFLEKDLSKIQ